jgi:hypothetical protein
MIPAQIPNQNKALQAVAKRRVLANTLKKRGGDTFESKVAWLKEHIPTIKDPEGVVSRAMEEIEGIR